MLENLLTIFEFDKKRKLEQYCRDIAVSAKDFSDLIICGEATGMPFFHQIHHRDIFPKHLELSDANLQALSNNPVGPLNPEARKTVRKVFQIFKDRRYLVGHIFYTADLSKWHFFCFDQRDLALPNHWEEGTHVHFINWLWPGWDARTAWGKFVAENGKPGDSIHLRFSEKDEATAVRE